MKINEVVNMAPRPKPDPKHPQVKAAKKIKDLKKVMKRDK